MPYLIDGHNLIGQLPDISLTDPNDEAQLVQKLNGFAARTGKRCVVIFDHGLPGGASRMSTGSVQVLFASRPGEADDLMLRRIEQMRDTKGWVVVTSDQRVIEAARRKGIGALRSAAFAQLLQDAPPRTRGKPPQTADDKPAYISPQEIEEWLKKFGGGE
ncbi:MAG: NYN domain-containing protein [Anaerolineae bacterium]